MLNIVDKTYYDLGFTSVETESTTFVVCSHLKKKKDKITTSITWDLCKQSDKFSWFNDVIRILALEKRGAREQFGTTPMSQIDWLIDVNLSRIGPVGWGCRINQLHICRRASPIPPRVSWTNNLIVRLQ